MRSSEPFKRIAIRESVYNKILEDRAKYEKNLGGGIWSISDTLSEWMKELKKIKEKGEK